MKKINTIFYLLSIAVFNQTVAMESAILLPRTLPKAVFYKGFKLTTTGIQRGTSHITYKIHDHFNSVYQKCIYSFFYLDTIITLNTVSYLHTENNDGYICFHQGDYLDKKTNSKIIKKLVKMSKKELEKIKSMKRVFILLAPIDYTYKAFNAFGYDEDFYNNDYEDYYTNIFKSNYHKKNDFPANIIASLTIKNKKNETSLNHNQEVKLEKRYYFEKKDK